MSISRYGRSSLERPYSESDIPQPTTQIQQCRRSASSPPLTLTLDSDLEDDVFAPRSDRTNDLFSTRNLDIFGYGSPRTPAGVLLSPRRERTFSFSMTSEKHWRDKGGTDVADGVTPDEMSDPDCDRDNMDETTKKVAPDEKINVAFLEQFAIKNCQALDCLFLVIKFIVIKVL
ncbi:hypothetical protein HF086_008881 [Spodoptera exigua]|uniref:Uncharacterized protein n=1 Tax=Spodoptera exigua TaxID=7107 RepID=A0A922SBM3_SPOEX|nr:hypothetical protein HF086_008881 [Spodoptera exigua]